MSTSAPSRTVVADFEEPGWDYGVFRSPYHELHRANGAKHCVYNLRLMPVSQGGDRITEYWALIMGPLLLLIVLFGRGGIMGVLGRLSRG